MADQTSWESVDRWYDAIVGPDGHYYHQQIVIPGVLRLLGPLNKDASVLDLACGQGVLARSLPKGVSYTGIDLAPSLIHKAKEKTPFPHVKFSIGDICKPLTIQEKSFSHSTIILALQNVEEPMKAIQNASSHLKAGGCLVIVLNHPSFRIPRQSHWGVDEKQKLQYRRVDRYLSPLKIPIQMRPGAQGESPTTWSFHHPLSSYSQWLKDAGCAITLIEEWASDKTSTGKWAKMENRARIEFPLFLAIQAKKI